MNSDLKLVQSKLKKITKVSKNVEISKICTFKIGGTTPMLIEPKTIEELIKTIDILDTYKVKYLIVGNCSNILFDSDGFDGAIIKMTSFNHIDFYGKTVIAESGVNLSQLIKECVDRGLSGLEDGYLIPATIGGAVRMNASAFNFKTETCIDSVLALVDGKIKEFSKEECRFGYRTNIFKDGDIILRVQFNLERFDKKQLKSRLNEIIELRKLKLNNLPSAGCVFKNPIGYSAGQLIEEASLKGYAIGGAMVSNKHANIITNCGGATSHDVKNLINLIKSTVKRLYDIDLELEIKIY